MPAPDKFESVAAKNWYEMLTTGEIDRNGLRRRIYKHLPREPRCQQCNAPFEGIGGVIVKTLEGIIPSNLNPRYCNHCETFARNNPGGAEVELAMVFADVRGSTTLAEKMDNIEFTRLIDRFYQEAGRVLIQSDGMIEKLIGDELAALYVPGYAGPRYPRRALQAARELIKVTGHNAGEEPWIPVGVGVHYGKAFVGALGAQGSVIEITALGDDVNVAARLCQAAKAGEIIASEAVCEAAGISYEAYEQRDLALKGRNEPVRVRILPV